MPKGQPSGDRIIWDDANEKHLLLCILAAANPQKLDWSKIAERFGKKLTSSAASQKYGKIRNRDKEIFEGAGAGGATPKSTGKKPTAKPATPGSKRTNGGKPKDATLNASSNATRDYDEEDDEFLTTPSKKVKTEAFAYEGFEHNDSGIDNE